MIAKITLTNAEDIKLQKTINGAMFRKMVLAAANLLEENRKYVDSLNVFPVPDGDTGTNMNLTFKSATKEVNECLNNNFDSLGEAIARGALRGARGNSGVILSQILKGMSTILVQYTELKTKDFASIAWAQIGVIIKFSAVGSTIGPPADME